MAPRKPGQQDSPKGGSIIATIQAATDSGERIGADAAIYILLILLSFVALVRVDPIWVAILDFIFIVGWNTNRYLRDRSTENKARISLERLRQTKGYELLQRFKKSPEQLSLLSGDDGNDAPE